MCSEASEVLTNLFKFKVMLLLSLSMVLFEF